MKRGLGSSWERHRWSRPGLQDSIRSKSSKLDFQRQVLLLPFSCLLCHREHLFLLRCSLKYIVSVDHPLWFLPTNSRLIVTPHALWFSFLCGLSFANVF
ncbi:hypothetical protein K503DRAFT_395819 [Rhizopogon vinicolor AM-OR11-026]|uniref:Uncharacterized protein n=1 Tax=Rhizopogon vinicolor AM-OR11-026 TaxID=1314800 RepID=A0A1B7NBL6_9AGAM|nr:hypothetical protein K503DRAFT_395819 [Rhizopogon vinicolor AM-OR11-026]